MWARGGYERVDFDFTGQIIGGIGVLLPVTVVVEDLKVLNTPGDGIRATGLKTSHPAGR